MSQYTFVSLLRGINIGGHHLISMPKLVALYESFGLASVTTYIQSGNVIFKTRRSNASALEVMLEQRIEKAFGFPLAVIIRSSTQLGRIVTGNPYVQQNGIDTSKIAVAFLKSAPSPALAHAIRELTTKSKDEYTLVGKTLYMHCRDGFAKTLLTNAFLEKHLRVKVTARNWKTTVTLFEMCRTLAP